MNWKLIVLLSMLGLGIGLATVWTIPSTIEPFFWLAAFIISALLIAKLAAGRHFLHGFMVSILNAVWVTAAHAAFFDTYSVTHPEYLEMTRTLSPDLAAHPILLLIPIGLISGILSGLLLGFFAWIASKLLNRNRNI